MSARPRLLPGSIASDRTDHLGQIVDPVTPVWLRWVGVSFPSLGALLCAVPLLLWSDDTAGHFAWRMSPISAVSIGALFVTVVVQGVVTIRSDSWLQLRSHLAGLATFLTVTLVGSIASRDLLVSPWDSSLHPIGRFISAIWIPALTIDLIGVVVASVYWVRHDPDPATAIRLVAEPTSLLAKIVLWGHCIGGSIISLGLLVPAWRGLWPWELGPIEAAVLGASLLMLSVMFGVSSLSDDSRVLGRMATLAITAGVGSIVGLFAYPHELRGSVVGLAVYVLLVGSSIGILGTVSVVRPRR